MNKRLAIILLLLSAASVALLWFGSRSESGIGRVVLREPLFPLFSPEAAQGVLITVDGASIALRTESFGWGIDRPAGYPTVPGRVEDLLELLAGATVLEERSSDPAFYERLGVAEGAPRVRVYDREADEIIDLLVGRSHTARGLSGTFVRKGAEETVLWIEGGLALSVARDAWIQRTIFDIPAERVERVTISRAGVPDIVLEPDQGTANTLRITEPPALAGKSHPALVRLTSGLSRFTVGEIAPREQIPMPEDALVRTRFDIAGGLVVEVSSVVASSGLAAAAFDVRATGPDAEQEASLLRRRVEGWVFQIGEARSADLRLGPTDF